MRFLGKMLSGLLLAFVCVEAQAGIESCIVISKTDGTAVYYQISNLRRITFDESNMNIESKSATVALPVADLVNYYFLSYMLDTGIEEIGADDGKIGFKIEEGRISVDGCRENCPVRILITLEEELLFTVMI